MMKNNYVLAKISDPQDSKHIFIWDINDYDGTSFKTNTKIYTNNSKYYTSVKLKHQRCTTITPKKKNIIFYSEVISNGDLLVIKNENYIGNSFYENFTQLSENTFRIHGERYPEGYNNIMNYEVYAVSEENSNERWSEIKINGSYRQFKIINEVVQENRFCSFSHGVKTTVIDDNIIYNGEFNPVKYRRPTKEIFQIYLNGKWVKANKKDFGFLF